MFRLFFLLIISLSYSSAITKSEIVSLYQNGNFAKLCKKTEWTFTKFKNDEVILSIISLACMKDDKLNSAVRTSRLMKNTKAGRANATYIANLYLIKRLLIQFIYDNSDLSNLSLPKSEHFLSKIFEHIAKRDYIKQNKKIIINLENIVYVVEPLDETDLDNLNKGKGIQITIIKDNIKSVHLFY